MNARAVRRTVAAGVALLALLDVWLAAEPEPLIDLESHIAPWAAVREARYVLLLAALAMLGVSHDLIRGKRNAWLTALTAVTVSLVAHPFNRADIVGAGFTVVALGGLAVTFRYFPARSDPVRAGQGVAWLLLGLAAVLLYGFLGLYLLDRDFRHSLSISESLESALRLLFIVPDTTIEPATHHGRWFIRSVRFLALAVLASGIWLILRPVIQRSTTGRTERALVRQILERYATTGIAYFHLLDDKTYFFSSSMRAFIGYRVVGGIAVVLGEPIGPPEDCVSVARDFAEHCEMNGWRLGFHQVTDDDARLLSKAGFRALKIGEEAIIPLEDFALDGKSFKHVRNVVNRLSRDGYTFESLSRPISDATMAELRSVSDEWLASGGHRERSFTLGSFEPGYLQETEVVVVRSPAGRIEAFANLLPPFASRNGNFDLMRRRPEAADGVMDFLFVRLIERFKAEGLEGMNLGFVPLANIEGRGVVARALRLFRDRGARAFNFEGLRAYKNKWHPRWEPRFLVYRSEIDLPALAVAIVRVGERSGQLPFGVRPPSVVRLRWRHQPS